MAKSIGTNVNLSDESTTPAAISIDSTTAVDLVTSRALNNPIRRLSVYNSGNQILWVRFYPASQDNLKLGERILPGTDTIFELPNMPLTNISAIFNSGGARNVYIQYI